MHLKTIPTNTGNVNTTRWLDAEKAASRDVRLRTVCNLPKTALAAPLVLEHR
jgi:hypothetical protein